RFGFMGWLDFDVEFWTDVRDQARRGVKKQLSHPIRGSDNRRDALALARANARAAGIGHLIHFQFPDARDFHPPKGPRGVMLCNPPYGERLGEEKDLRVLYETLGQVFRERCEGWKCYVFTGNPRLARQIGIKPIEQVPLYNGRIPCRLLRLL